MATYNVLLTRDATESVNVVVEAETPGEAIEKALKTSGRYGENLNDWAVDEGNHHEVHVCEEPVPADKGV